MEKMAVIKEVERLLSLKCVEEIAIWHYDADVLLLDGTVEHYEWGCSLDQMSELCAILNEALEGYTASFSGYDVSWECVRIVLTKESEVYKQFVETPVSMESKEGRLRRSGRFCVKNPPNWHSNIAHVGYAYFHR